MCLSTSTLSSVSSFIILLISAHYSFFFFIRRCTLSAFFHLFYLHYFLYDVYLSCAYCIEVTYFLRLFFYVCYNFNLVLFVIFQFMHEFSFLSHIMANNFSAIPLFPCFYCTFFNVLWDAHFLEAFRKFLLAVAYSFFFFDH